MYGIWNIIMTVLLLTGILCWAGMIILVLMMWLTDLRSEE